MERNTIIISSIIVLLIIIWLYYRSSESFTSISDQIGGSQNCNYLIIPDSTTNEPSMDSTNARNLCKNCDGCGICSNQIGMKNISECVTGNKNGPVDSRIFCQSYEYQDNQPIMNTSPTPKNILFNGKNYCHKSSHFL